MRVNRITIEPGKRGGQPTIRGLRITVYDVLRMLADGMSEAEILDDFPELETADIRASLVSAADRDHNTATFIPGFLGLAKKGVDGDSRKDSCLRHDSRRIS
jgi:uncharacterized protein (DUF433 family)